MDTSSVEGSDSDGSNSILSIDNIILDYYLDSDEEITVLSQADIIAAIGKKDVSKRKRKRRRIINRDFELAHRRIMQDYLVCTPRFSEEMFRRRFRMSSRLFVYICNELEKNISYFKQKKDGIGRSGLSCLQKVVAAFRMLAYGESADRQDEYCSIAETTATKTRKMFCRSIVSLFSEVYLRKPTLSDVQTLLHQNAARGFPGMIGLLRQYDTQYKSNYFHIILY